ncbi:RNase J family beta-CASP ribonuclease [Candidatus Falkowbacteria bacterium]|nr:RNase J family beta-CASP ribonuclease [Candidatus Falkowbacteria bacterium]
MITKYKPKASRSMESSSESRKPRRVHSSRRTASNRKDQQTPKIIKTDSNGNVLKVMVLGGLEEVGRNMSLIEYNKEIIIIDMGLQFPEEDMPGIDYIIPNIEYLKDKKDWIKGVIITHGHMDHIGGIPHLIGDLGNPPIFMGKLTAGLVRKRCEQFKTCPKLNSQEIDESTHLKLGSSFRVGFLRLNHSIPDCFGIIIDTPMGRLIHTGDFKIDYSPVNDKPANLQKIANIGSEGVMLLMADSTDATHPGYQVSESTIGTEMDRIFEKIDGRIIIGTFASQLSRIQKLFDLAAKYNRRVYLQGRTMNNNVEVAHQIGYLKFNPKILANDSDLKKLPDNKILIVGTGAQGESNAFLARVVAHEHRTIHLKNDDTVIFSSSVIPGNERTIQSLKDMITRQGAHVIHYEMMDVHAGGHAKQEDLKLMMRLLKPEYFMPIEGNHYLLKAHAELAEQVGIPKSNIFVADNGQVVKFIKNRQGVKGYLSEEKIPSNYIFVDGLGVGDISNIVLRDRKVMSEDGMVVIIATIDSSTGRTIGNPDIISRGFVYMKESKELIESTRMKVKKMVENHDSKTQTDVDHIKNRIRDEMGQYLFSKTKRRPMVLPVVIKV